MTDIIKENYTKDSIGALEAKFEAQKIAFAPLVFQAVVALFNMGVLKAVSDSGEQGLTIAETAQKTGISPYAARVLLEMALGLNLVKVLPQDKDRFILGKVGWFLMEEEMNIVNINFMNDVCYKGAFELTRSLKDGKPRGLEVFTTEKNTIYDALSTLPKDILEKWLAFDHFYSDITFKDALPIVFADKPKKIIDIGGNTAKWAICCCRYDPNVEVLIVDLPGQTKMAEQKAAEAGFSDRITTLSCNILDEKSSLPAGADVIWMSQFLDCFSPEEIINILTKVKAAAGPSTKAYILEPFWDKQRYPDAAYTLQAISLYFTCMANGNSKMYGYDHFVDIVKKADIKIINEYHDLGALDYSLLCCGR